MAKKTKLSNPIEREKIKDGRTTPVPSSDLRPKTVKPKDDKK